MKLWLTFAESPSTVSLPIDPTCGLSQNMNGGKENTHAAPVNPLSLGPPISAVSPSPDSVTLSPKELGALSPVAVNFGPCWVQVPAESVNVHAAPEPSRGPPISAVPASVDSDTLWPKHALAALIARGQL